ncbi:hypothetical protein N566_19135, partial [Streptomycetaceae bacterium MP113-05]
RPAHGTRVDPALLRHVAATVRRALAESGEGDVLCFLPGVGEIGRVAALLDGCGAEVLQLHGRAPAAAQDAVLHGRDREPDGDAAGKPEPERRVVLATSVAESSLTVPGVRIVVDSGLAREPRVDHARGLDSLTTVRVSRATAEQRQGRAGREAPGVVHRCWPPGEDAGRPKWPSPEIMIADLTTFALQAAAWGEPDATGLALLDLPPSGAMSAAGETLRAVGAVDASGRITGRGARMARMGVHPRLARALLDGAPLVGARAAAEVVALLSEEPPREYGDDLTDALRAARRGRDGYAVRWSAEVRRLRSALRTAGDAPEAATDRDQDGVGLPVALAYPERVAVARGGQDWLMANGTRAQSTERSPLRGAAWLAVAVADRPVGSPTARVRLAAAIDEATARTAAAALLETGEDVRWDADRGDVIAAVTERLGSVELSSRPLQRPAPDRVRAAVLDGLRREGTRLLRWTGDARALRERLAFLHRALGAPWPDVSERALLARAEEWLGAAGSRADLARTDAADVLRGLLPWTGGEAARLDTLAPERVQVPSGSRVRVDYATEQPVLAVKLQELFGWQDTPPIADGRVALLVHLLSPAGRPAAVTGDLAGFWREGYRAVRAELRGRYPRHPWPEDPATAEPTRRVKPRR